VVSPWAKRGYVSSVVQDLTSVLRFVERKWNLGAITRRDANAADMTDYFDFRRPGFREPPRIAAAPHLGPGLEACRTAGLHPPTPQNPNGEPSAAAVRELSARARGGPAGALIEQPDLAVGRSRVVDLGHWCVSGSVRPWWVVASRSAPAVVPFEHLGVPGALRDGGGVPRVPVCFALA